jgi:hypothetical protein
MTGSQEFILYFLFGGAASGALFLAGLGVYYWGRGHYEKNKQQ